MNYIEYLLYLQFVYIVEEFLAFSPLFSVQHPVKLKCEVECAGDCNGAEEILKQPGLVAAEHQTILLHQVQEHLEHLLGSSQDEN